MSSLIFSTDEKQILVATDTLAVSDDGKPFMFTSKAIYISHLRIIIAGTGCGGFSGEWVMHINNHMVVKGIQNLDYHTPKTLRELWEKYVNEYSLPSERTTTVYQFGFTEKTGKVISFAYRSTNDFCSERLPYGVGVKPECNVPEGNLFELIPIMMKEQRDIQDGQPKNERLYIGGEIHALYLSEDGCNSLKLGEFPDFRDQEKEIFRRFDANKNES